MTGDQLDLIDPHGLAEQAGRRVTVAEIAKAAATMSRSPNTERAFLDDWRTWRAFVDWATGDGIDAVLYPEKKDQSDQLVSFATWLAIGGRMPDGAPRKPAAPETIRRRLTGVLHGWAQNDHDYPRNVSKAARDWVKFYENQLIEKRQPTGRGQAAPLRITDLYKIVTAIDADTSPTYPALAKARDTSLVLMTWALGARRSEVAFLDVDDLTVTDDGLEVLIRRSKSGHRTPAVPFADDPDVCPVLAWRRWQQRAAIVTGAAFRRVDQHGNLGGRMSGEAVAAVLTRAGERAGLDHRLIGHSPRRGLATEGRRKGKSIEKIADQGGWSRTSPVLHGYIADVDKWTDNVLRGLL